MVLSWEPNLEADNSTVWTPGLDLNYGIYEADATATDVLFIYTPDVCSLSVEMFTERARHVLANGSAIGDIRFSVWTRSGANVDTDLEIIVDGGPDEWVSWAVMFGQLPYANAQIVVDAEVSSLSDYDLATGTGPVLGCVASLDAVTDPTIVYPGDFDAVGRNYTHAGDTISGDLRTFASDLPGTFDITSTTMRRVVLLGPPSAVTARWRVGRIGWPT